MQSCTVCALLYTIHTSMGARVDHRAAQRVQLGVDPGAGKDPSSGESDCDRRIDELTTASTGRLDLYTGTCGVLQEDFILAPDGSTGLTLDGRSRICSPTCQETSSLKTPLTDIETIRRECPAHGNSLAMMDGFIGLLHGLDTTWQSCATTGLRKSDCKCDFTWNSFQHSYAVMVNIGKGRKTTPAERSGMYHRYKRECGCEAVKANKAGIIKGDIIASEDSAGDSETTELHVLQELALWQSLHKTIMAPTCEGVTTLFEEWDIRGTGSLGYYRALATLDNLKQYQQKEIKDEGELTEALQESDHVKASLESHSAPITRQMLEEALLGTDGAASCN